MIFTVALVGDFVATHAVWVSPRNRQEGTHKRWRAEPPTSGRELRGLRRILQDSSFASIAEISKKLDKERINSAGGSPCPPVSVYTVRRPVKGVGLYSCVAAQKPFFSSVNMKKRVQWAKEYKAWSYQRAFVFFSDESSFMVRQPQARRVLRQPGQRFAPDNYHSFFNSGRQSVGGGVPRWVKHPC